MKMALIIASGALAIAGLVWVYDNYSGLVREHYRHRKFPAIQGQSELGKAVTRDLQTKKYRATMREYQRVLARLDQAARSGHNVRYLRRKMPRVIRLARAGNHEYARIHLNTIDVRIPRKRTSVKGRVLRDTDFRGDPSPKIGGRPAKRRGSSRRRSKRSKRRRSR